MTLAIILTPILLSWLLASRVLYHRWRGVSVSHRDCDTHGEGWRRKVKREHGIHVECCYDAPAVSDGEATLWAMLAGLAWPVIAVVAVVRWHPPVTEAAKAGRLEQLQANISKLQEEVDRER